MKVVIDTEKCILAGECHFNHPELFDKSEDGIPIVLVDDLFGEFLASVGAALDLPIFDGGRRRAEGEAAEAELDARYAEYRLTFLDALGETENALVAIGGDDTLGVANSLTEQGINVVGVPKTIDDFFFRPFVGLLKRVGF